MAWGWAAAGVSAEYPLDRVAGGLGSFPEGFGGISCGLEHFQSAGGGIRTKAAASRGTQAFSSQTSPFGWWVSCFTESFRSRVLTGFLPRI